MYKGTISDARKIYIGKRMQVEYSLTPYMKINSNS